MLSPEQIERFTGETASRFKIGAEHAGALAKFLRESTGQFHPKMRIKSAAEQQTDLRAELEPVGKAQQVLAKALDSLSELARDRLWHPLWETPNRPPGLVGFATFPSATEYPDEMAFRESLTAFTKRIEARLYDLRLVKNKGGQPEHTGLRVWVARARDFWTETLGRKFTYQYVKGAHKGQAFVFCSFLLERIAPDITDSELATAIRAMIKPMRVATRGGPAPQTIIIKVRAKT
jgi:hypothetical protein